MMTHKVTTNRRKQRETLRPLLRTLGGSDLTAPGAARREIMELPDDDVIMPDEQKMPPSTSLFHLNPSKDDVLCANVIDVIHVFIFSYCSARLTYFVTHIYFP